MKIKLRPIASESLGVRSICIFIETPDVKILADAGAALGPRFGMVPYPNEYEVLKEARK